MRTTFEFGWVGQKEGLVRIVIWRKCWKVHRLISCYVQIRGWVDGPGSIQTLFGFRNPYEKWTYKLVPVMFERGHTLIEGGTH